jgi:protease IV
MKLLRSAWKLLVAVKDALVLILLLIFFGGLFALMSSTPNPGSSDGGALLVSLDGALVEQRTEADPRSLLTGTIESAAEVQVRDVVHALRTASEDSAIKAVVLDLDSFTGGGQVSLMDVASAIDAVRAAKKPVYAFATGYYDDSYLLAAHASEVWLDPMGATYIAGPGGKQPYFKGLLDRYGINVRVYRVGKFKSFVEPYTLTGQSDEARAANLALYTSVWDAWKADVAKARPKAQIDKATSVPVSLAGAGGLAQSAIDAGLVDRLGDPIAFGRRVAEVVTGDESRGPGHFRHSTLGAYIAANPPPSGGDTVGIVHIAGSIVDGRAPLGTAGGDSIAQLIDHAINRLKVKALVLRIDSGGGSALASEKIRLAALEARKKNIPVVVSMANVAASGGYWVAMAGDKVFAEPSTITGSIGVFGILPTFEKTLAQYGVTTDGVQTTPLSGQPDILGGTNAETDALFQTGVEDIYRRFTALVSGQRKLPLEKVQEIAQGRVWDGGSARQLGLIDAFGSLDDAVAEAAKRAGIDADDTRTIYVEPPVSLLQALLGSLTAPSPAQASDPLSAMVARQQAQLVGAMQQAMTVASGPAVQIRCLECPAPAARQPRQSLYQILTRKVFN